MVPKNDVTLGLLTKVWCFSPQASAPWHGSPNSLCLSQLLALACSAADVVTHAVDKRSCSVPAVNTDIMDKFYPLLADLILEVRRHGQDALRQALTFATACPSAGAAERHSRRERGA